jgi:hypothetical protein
LSHAREQADRPVRAPTAAKADTPPLQKLGFWGRIVEMLGGGNEPQRAKRRRLKAIAREVRRDRADYYMPATDSAGPGLAKFLYTFYRDLASAQSLLEAAASSEALRSMVVESCLSQDERGLRLALSPESIKEASGVMDSRRLADKVKQDLGRFAGLFDRQRETAIDARMRDFWVLLDLVSFDYYGLLKRFDPALPRSDFLYAPSFGSADSALVSAPLKDFLEILAGVDQAAEWDALFDVLKEYRQVDPVSRDAWRKLLRTVDRLAKSDVLLNVVRLMDKEPDALIGRRDSMRRSAEEYLEKVRAQAELALQKQLASKHHTQITALIQKTFGRTPEERLVHYVVTANPGFQKRGTTGYMYAVPLNYLKIYLDDFFEAEVKSVLDLMLVKGLWGSASDSRSISENLQTALKLINELQELDDSLSDDGARGQKMKLALNKASRNKKDAYILRQVVRTVNDAAKVLLGAGAHALVALGKVLKALIDDFGSPKSVMVQNWRDLDLVADRLLRERLVAAYTRLYNLMQLLAQFREAPGVP